MIIRSIALNTFKESSRNKIFLVFLGLAIAGILLTKAVAFVSPETEQKMVIDFGILAISFFGTIIAIFNGSSLVYKDIEKKTIYTVLTKPISRAQFIVGKFLGLLLSISVSIGALSVVLTLYCLAIGIQLSPAFYWALFFIYIQIALITSVSIVFSLISSPLLSATFSLLFYIFGYWLEGLKDLLELIESDVGKKIIVFVYELLPKLFYLDLKYQASHGLAIPVSHLLVLFVHGVSYIVLFLVLSTLLMNRKSL